MFSSRFLESLSQTLSNTVPRAIETLEIDLQSEFKHILTQAFDAMNLVSREEFDAQRRVLMKTREKVESLEQLVETLLKKA